MSEAPPFDQQQACRRARELVAAARVLLVKVGADQNEAQAQSAAYLELWRELRFVAARLGSAHPLLETATTWDWFARCQQGDAVFGTQAVWLDADLGPFLQRLGDLEKEAARGPVPFGARYYQDGRQRQPVLEYIAELRDATKAAACVRAIRKLNALTDAKPYLSFPQGAPLAGTGDGFFELRIHVGEHHRIIYRPLGKALVLLHGFKKEGWEVPEDDKVVASNRWNDLVDRLGTEPDPIGGSAP